MPPPAGIHRRALIIAAGALSALAIVPVAGIALTQARPSAPAGANRVRDFRLDIDRNGVNEHILVFNLDQSGQPTTWLSVWNRRRDGRWERPQYTRVFGPSPGSRESGLKSVYAGDLNKDGRYEVAALDFITPSVGEELTIFRQTRVRGLTFRPLQVIVGDRIARVPSGPGQASQFAVTIKANHSPDGRLHNERWAWTRTRQRWTCVSGPAVCVSR
jgi:hypothetical protein